MEILSKLKLENNIVVCLNLKNNNLHYELEYENNYDGEPYEKFSVYEKNDKGSNQYNNTCYEKVKQSSITKNKPLKEGSYLFIFNRTKMFIDFVNNKISYELEDIGFEKEIDLS